MMLDRWRARRAIRTRTPPHPIADTADPALFAAVESLKEALDAPDSMGDPSWHFRWDGALQLVGLDATTRSVSDVRQRLTRLVHELDLSHMPRDRKRVVAVVLCDPSGYGGIEPWHLRLVDDQGEVGPDWNHVRRRVAVLAITRDGERRLFGGDRQIADACQGWLSSTGA